MLISDFDYELPPELIAQEPRDLRDSSRMLLLNRSTGRYCDDLFANLPDLLEAGDCIVLNNTRVFPARLTGRRVRQGETIARGAAVEALLVRPLGEPATGPNGTVVEWEALAKPGRSLQPGAEIFFGNDDDPPLRAVVTGILDEGRRSLRFTCRGDFNAVVDSVGQPPLPPYIKRTGAEGSRLDAPRYQTVYASRRGAIAAPTAGLHFTPRILERLKTNGIETVEITHHVGYATFQPVRVDVVEEHRIASESYLIEQEAARRINAARAAGGRIIAIGTTCVRALESAANPDRTIRAEQNSTQLFIYPGYNFRAIDGLLTNFHLPKSSLLMLVSAFAGRDRILDAYRHAVSEKYRFFSYGDCMLICDRICK